MEVRMAIAMLVEIPGLTQEQYEQAAQQVNQAGPALGGALIHGAGPMEGGGCRVVEVWETQEAADAFYNSDFFRQIAAEMPQPKITRWPLYALGGNGLTHGR
jgi:hypothetical protein